VAIEELRLDDLDIEELQVAEVAGGRSLESMGMGMTEVGASCANYPPCCSCCCFPCACCVSPG
jgi:hypothetical protein